MTFKSKECGISKSLHLFLDLYERDPTAPHNLLSLDLDPLGLLEDDLARVPLAEQFELLKKASKSTREEILRKTLIETQVGDTQHAVIQEYLERPEKIPPLYEDPEQKKQWGGSIYNFESEQATERGMSYAQYKASCVRQKLSEKKTEAELLRFFADRIEQIADSIDILDDTDFSKLIPECLIIPFRECHINFALGNYGTVCVLSGSILERALKDLLNVQGCLESLIDEASKDGLLNDIHMQYASAIRKERNKVVHGERDFASVTANRAFECLWRTRSLVRELYRDRL
jgi:hypothetical protein